MVVEGWMSKISVLWNWRGLTKSAPGVIGPRQGFKKLAAQKSRSDNKETLLTSEGKDPESLNSTEGKDPESLNSTEQTHNNQHDAKHTPCSCDGETSGESGESSHESARASSELQKAENEHYLETANRILDQEYSLLTELNEAVTKGGLKDLELILDQKKIPAEELCKAVKDGRLEAAKFKLEQKGILVTELREAVKKGDVEVAKVMVKEGHLEAAKPILDQKKKQLKELHKAVKKGNLIAVKRILDPKKELITEVINGLGEIALHVAAYAGHTSIVEYLVGLMDDKDLTCRNKDSNTALNLVSQGNNVGIAEILVKNNTTLLDIKGSDGKLPLQTAAIYGKRDMVMYLYGESKILRSNPLIDEMRGLWTFKNRGCVLLACVHAELFYVAQKMVSDFPELAQSEGNILEVLALKHDAFNTKKHRYRYNAYDGCVDEGNEAVQFLRTILANVPKPKLYVMLREPADQVSKAVNPEEACQKYSSRVLSVAVEKGNTAFVAVLIGENPELVLELNENKQNLFQVAVLYRRAGIFDLLHGVGSIKDSIINAKDKNDNNLLHSTGILEETTNSNQWEDLREPNVQMEKEEMWFKMVADMLPTAHGDMKNKDGLTPLELFTKNHKELFLQAVESEKKAVSGLYSPAVSITLAVVTVTLTLYYQKTLHFSLPIALLNGTVFVLGCFSVLSTLMFPHYPQHNFISLRSWGKTILTAIVMAVVLLLLSVPIIYLIKKQYIALIVMVIFPFLYWVVCHHWRFRMCFLPHLEETKAKLA